MSTFERYLLFQVPGWILSVAILAALWHLADLPAWIAALLFFVWLVKDLVLYPVLRSAYETDHRVGAERLVGERARTRERLAGRGFVKLRGELWQAELAEGEPAVDRGEEVEVVGVRGTRLLVRGRSID